MQISLSMSTPTSIITIQNVLENELVIRIRPTTIYNGFLNGYGFTRSYVLAALGWYPQIRNSEIEIEQIKIINSIKELAEKEGIEFWCVEKGFYERYADYYIIDTEIVNKDFDIKELKDIDIIESEINEIEQNGNLSLLEKEEQISFKLNPVILRIKFKKKEFLNGLHEGIIIETTAQDRWWDDPTNPY